MLWRGPGEFVPATRPAEPGPDVADSWLVNEGRCRGLAEHRARFAGNCRRPASLVHRFLDDAVAALPRRGRWFPRIDCTDGELTLWRRPAPPLSSEVVIWVPEVPVDPRTAPATKGPDLPVLQELRRRAATVGAGEALLVSPDGTVREGALSTLLWWRGDTLCCPPDGPDLLPGVTGRLLLEIAAGRGQPVRRENVPPAALDGLEVWSVSALHGIRSVTGWRGCELAAAPAVRAGEWRRALLDRAEAL